MQPANEKRRYNATSSLIDWTHMKMILDTSFITLQEWARNHFRIGPWFITETVWSYWFAFTRKDPIGPQYCTCHDGPVGGVCAKLPLDRIIIFHQRPFAFTTFGLWAYKELSTISMICCKSKIKIQSMALWYVCSCDSINAHHCEIYDLFSI